MSLIQFLCYEGVIANNLGALHWLLGRFGPNGQYFLMGVVGLWFTLQSYNFGLYSKLNLINNKDNMIVVLL